MGQVGRRIMWGLAAWVLVLGGTRALLAQPEHCHPASPEAMVAAAQEAVDWAVRTQRPDGRWIYRYLVDDDRDAGIYEMVRHAGHVMSLYQAARYGLPGALESADAGLEVAMGRVVAREDWQALANNPAVRIETGASALLLAGLTFRREATDDPRHDGLMADLARFLTRVVEPHGAVSAWWDPATGAPARGQHSQFYTGEAFWALARMHTLFPGDGWDEPALRIAAYLPHRDEAEDWFPPIPDHWAAYGLAEMAGWPDRAPGELIAGELADYAWRQAELQSMQVRYESQRTNSLPSVVTRGSQALGSGVGSMAEGLTMLERLELFEGTALGERTDCALGLLLHRQVSAAQAEDYPNPPFVRGTWLHKGATQIDDQQHALSALLNRLETLPDPPPPAAGPPEELP